MRTTLILSDEAAEFAKTYARARGLRLGEAVSELVIKAKRGREPIRIKRVNGIPVFDVPKSARKVTNEDVKKWLEDFP